MIMKQTLFKATMLLLAIITTASAWAGSQPRCCLDYCEGGVNNIFVTGWAFDPDVPAAYNITGNHGFQTFIPIDDVGT